MTQQWPSADSCAAPHEVEGTPLLLLCPTQLRESYRSFQAAFPGASIHYAMKANGHPEVLRCLAAAGASFEVASIGEYEELIEACGHVPPERIIFGTSVKPVPAMQQLTKDGVDRMAADSREELERMALHAPGARVMLRAVVGDGRSVFTMSEKFGAPIADIPDLASFAASLGLVPYALSFNVGSQAGEVDAWSEAIQVLRPALVELESRGIPVEALNLGGGYPFAYLGQAEMRTSSIADAVESALRSLPYRPALLLEPGRAIVASAVDLYSTVVSRVRRGTRDWLYLDAGVYNALFEALACQGTTRYDTELWSRLSGSTEHDFVVAGPTGDGLDVISESVLLPSDVQPGDVLRLRGAGAYTNALACSFNGFPPARLSAHAVAATCPLCAGADSDELPEQRQAGS